VALARRKILSASSLAVVVTGVPVVTGENVTIGPPLGPLPLGYQSLRLGDHW
jgi:hypothetical protein